MNIFVLVLSYIGCWCLAIWETDDGQGSFSIGDEINYYAQIQPGNNELCSF